jgi:hypothetical protein
MPDEFISAEYTISSKSKIKKIYEKNKVLIYFLLGILIAFCIFFTFYLKNKESKRILLAENYIIAKIYLEEKETDKALKILKEITYANDSTYSLLSFFLILNQNLINNENEVFELFNHILKENKIDPEIRNLLIYKKALYSSSFITEKEMLDGIKPLLKIGNIWKPHALLLLGDYFTSKNENLKAKEFYKEILMIKNLQKNIYDQVISKLSYISNE